MNQDQEIFTLKEQVRELQGRLEALESFVKNIADGHLTTTKFLRENAEWLTENQGNIWDRIMNLETTVFPHLTEDLNRVQKIIGDGEEKGDNPLDRRAK